jgi:outer membrane biosynthesis protein TonB
MRKLTIMASLGALALAACGSPGPPADNQDAANLALNAIVANDVTVAKEVSDTSEAEAEAPPAAAPAPSPKAAPPPAPKVPAPKPAAKPPEPEPKPEPAPACTPEHRAAGHC